MARTKMDDRWIVYVKTGEPIMNHGRVVKPAPAVPAKVLDQYSVYKVEMPDGEIKSVTDADLQYAHFQDHPIEEAPYSLGGNPNPTGTEYTHPSFASIGISHVQGHKQIHGSKVDRHLNYVMIRIYNHATETHDLGRNWYGGGDVIAEVALSPARFAEFLSTTNRGNGIPCSLTYHSPRPGPGHVPGWPKRDTEVKRIVDRIRGMASEAVQRTQNNRDALEALLSKVSAKKREEALKLFDDAARLLHDSTPFLVDSAVEALEHHQTESKAEIEAFVTSAIHSAGVEAIREDPRKLLRKLPPPPPRRTIEED